MTGPSDSTVAQMHAVWDEANQRVRAHERLLAEALKLYEDGKAPIPLSMIDEVQAMRSECNRKFKEMLAALGKTEI